MKGMDTGAIGHRVRICASTYSIACTLIDELSSMERMTIRFCAKKAQAVRRRGEPNGSKINCLFLTVKGLSARVIHIEVETVLHKKAVGYSTDSKYLRCARFGGRDAIRVNSDDVSMRILLTREFYKLWHCSHSPLSAKWDDFVAGKVFF
jgi:hypothetical protein